ncbi:lipid A biosynthesis lauroyl acyltransferase [mine drainage metagenome]|uniref:Lipid A biosynthesis lauroyl acyltransferase n=1 Tax=mine drainage metagenome TaxID=410659 RepID=A0A1J5RTK7_9ZZZZ
MAFLFRFLARLPLPLLHNLGALAGWLVYAASPTYRRHLRENTAQAGVEKARPAAVAEAGKSILELPKIWLRPQEEVIERIVRVFGWELVEAAWREQRGILFLTPHLGCYEITAQYYAARRPITVLYRPPKRTWLASLLEQGRGANLKLAPADFSGVRLLMRALRRREAVGILPDQVPGQGEGVWAPFFGRPAYTMTLAVRLAEAGATVLLAYAERLAYGAGYRLHLRTLAAPLAGTLAERAAQLNGELELLVRECPEQYLWGYNRYKVPAGVSGPGVRAESC